MVRPIPGRGGAPPRRARPGAGAGGAAAGLGAAGGVAGPDAAGGVAGPDAAGGDGLSAPDAPVEVAFLDHAGPRPGEVLLGFAAAGVPTATVVPLLLTAAYHNRVDLPAVLQRARDDGLGIPVTVSDVLGPVGGMVPQGLLDGLCRRLAETGTSYDAIVLAAAGTRHQPALATVDQAARALGARLGVPCLAAYASASTPTGGEAVTALRREGARRVVVAGYFLAPGRLYDTAVASALDAGAVAASAPLGDAPELAQLVRHRVAAARALQAAA
jgi:sirohydrochlorin ferrochelatase